MKRCYFIGHRDAPEAVYCLLAEAVNRHITQYGVTEFVVGGYGRFDSMAARAVKEAKKNYTEVTLLLLLPYYSAERPNSLPQGFDGMFYPPGMEFVPKRVAIVRANKYMVDSSDHLIAYAWCVASNSRKLVEYAMKKERTGGIYVENLAQKLWVAT